MTIRRVSFLTAVLLAALFVSVTALKIQQLYQEQTSVRKMALAAEAASSLNEAIIELSLERSVMQVSLNLPGAIAPQFRDLLDGQRRLSDAGFETVSSSLEASDSFRRAGQFLGQMRKLRNDIQRIRTRADELLAVGRDARNAKEVADLPTRMKSLIEGFAHLPGKLSAEDAEVPGLVETLKVVQMRAWEIREYGGQERSYFAIATATGDPIAATTGAEMAALHKRAVFGLDALNIARDYDGLPPNIAMAIDDVQAFYTGPYETARERILRASSDGTPYPITFPQFFDLSSDALGRAVSLSKAAGAATRAELSSMIRSSGLELAAYWGLLILAMAVCGFQIFYTRYYVARRMDGIVELMGRLTEGDTSVDSSPYRSGDEIGKMADTVEVFRNWILEKSGLEAQAAEERERAEKARNQAIRDMADRVEDKTKSSVGDVNAVAGRIADTAGEMQRVADIVGGSAANVSLAAEQALANSEAVSAAAGELSVSISGISSQLASASTVAKESLELADEVQVIVTSLNEAVENVSNVMTVISDIANQTNLLALNATIEAARAGEMGKGFAVVATEVKNLASQTQDSTALIGTQVEEMKNVTDSAVAAIDKIASSVRNIGASTADIAAAVEQQNSATDGIAQNIKQSTDGTREVSKRIAEVAKAAEQVTTLASEVASSSASVTGQVDELQNTLVRVIRTSDPAADRRTQQIPVSVDRRRMV